MFMHVLYVFVYVCLCVCMYVYIPVGVGVYVCLCMFISSWYVCIIYQGTWYGIFPGLLQKRAHMDLTSLHRCNFLSYFEVCTMESRLSCTYISNVRWCQKGSNRNEHDGRGTLISLRGEEVEEDTDRRHRRLETGAHRLPLWCIL